MTEIEVAKKLIAEQEQKDQEACLKEFQDHMDKGNDILIKYGYGLTYKVDGLGDKMIVQPQLIKLK